MKRKNLVLIVLMSVCLSPSMAFASSQTTKIYDKHHNIVGKVVTNGQINKVYNKSNNLTDYYKHDGSMVKHYKRNGNFVSSYKQTD